MRISDWSSDVCSAGLDDALDVARRGHRGDELADDRARDRRVAVGEMESIRTAGRTVAGGGVPHHLGIRAIEPHAVESRQPDTPAIERGLGIDADARSEERRVGKEWVSTFRSRWAPDH